MKQLTNLFIFIIILNSCSQNQKKINIPTFNHLQILDLKDNVQMLEVNYYLNKISPGNYIPTDKTTDLPSVSNYYDKFDFTFNLFGSDFSICKDLYYATDPSTILLYEIFSSINLKRNYSSNYKIWFNKDGYITKLISSNNNIIYNSIEIEYNKNNFPIYIKKKGRWESFKELDIEEETIIYNSNNLQSQSIRINGSKEKYTTNYLYDYNDAENSYTVYADSFNTHSFMKYFLDNDNFISKVNYYIIDNARREFVYENGLPISYLGFDNDGKLSNQIELKYNTYKTAHYKNTTRFNDSDDLKYMYSECNFKYNNNDETLDSLKIYDENGFNIYASDAIFIYKMDNSNNWTEQSYNINRKYYDYALKSKTEFDKNSVQYFNKYGYEAYEKKQSEIIKSLVYTESASHQIKITREIKYY